MLTATFPGGIVLTNRPGIDPDGVFRGSWKGIQVVYLKPGTWKGKVIDSTMPEYKNAPLETCGETTVQFVTQSGDLGTANGVYVTLQDMFYTPSPWLPKDVAYWQYALNDQKIVYGSIADPQPTPTPSPTPSPVKPKGTEWLPWLTAKMRDSVANASIKDAMIAIIIMMLIYGIATGKLDWSSLTSALP